MMPQMAASSGLLLPPSTVDSAIPDASACFLTTFAPRFGDGACSKQLATNVALNIHACCERAPVLFWAMRATGDRRTFDTDVFGRGAPSRLTQQVDERVAGDDAACRRATSAAAAGAVELAGVDAGQAQARAFGAPDRAVAVPDGDGGAAEPAALWRDGRLLGEGAGGCEEEDEGDDDRLDTEAAPGGGGEWLLARLGPIARHELPVPSEHQCWSAFSISST